MSFRMIVADDEQNICQMIPRLLRLQDLDCEILGFAYSGDMLLDMILEQKPDIVITDIQMPVMDGLEVIKSVRDADIDCQFIVISGYRQFEYAYNAMKYGVKHYILKPIDAADLNKAVAATIEQISQDTNLSENISSVRAQIFNVRLTLPDSAQTLETAAVNDRYLTRFQPQDSYRIFAVRLDVPAQDLETNVDIHQIHLDLWRYAEELFSACCHDVVCAKAFHGIICLLSFPPESKNEISSALQNFLTKAQILGESYCAYATNIGVSRVSTGGISLDDLVTEANVALWSRLFTHNQGSILYYQEAAPYANPILSAKLKSLEKRLRRAFDIFDSNEFTVCVDELFSLPPRILCTPQMYQKIQEIPDLLFQINAERFPEQTDQETLLRQIRRSLLLCGTASSYEKELKKQMTELLQMLNTEKDKRDIMPIRAALTYIEKNYAHPIHIEELAELTNLNPVYFSSLFRKETGQTFTEYLSEFRMSQARNLLATTNMNVAEIAYEVGFNDPRYFSRMFKKSVGLKPTEYRKIL